MTIQDHVAWAVIVLVAFIIRAVFRYIERESMADNWPEE